MMTELRLSLDNVNLADMSDDIESLVSLPENVLDLSPSFRRLLFDLEDALVEATSPDGDGSVPSASSEWVPQRVWTGPTKVARPGLPFRRG